MMMNTPFVPLPWGDLIDKITILEIKTLKLATEAARENAANELKLLTSIAAPVLLKADIPSLVRRLKAVNELLWETENRIREHEFAANFGSEFVALARSVYQRNDERSAIKREINVALQSALFEEKSYSFY